MSFVLDASVTLAWFFEDEQTDATQALLQRLRDEDAVVPSIWMYEVCNQLARAMAKGRVDADQISVIVGTLGDLAIELASPAPIPMIHAAVRHGLTAYDVAYLEIADARGIPLATLDKRLRTAAAKAGVGVLPEALD
ncbi:MAG TPA: type II toxin-antitoxin system VapC family toxin [Microbacteriaceae bacterium]|nr:type II toxin-antitoxin system VapC family toxin [Microbacteriaceae bacterium]